MEESEGRPVTVALVEDDDGARARLVASICAEPTMRLAGDWRTGAEALAHLASEAPARARGTIRGIEQ